ncbi:hypothetical protein FVEG_14702 [Fusarium verticillioides 7600]|uniref:LYR motif-containing protein 2 n=1 Tax=Gibberella moniliformis (strain M3125 / FGSC 7600) TaxID=334819 RepID=W7LMS1_GIBM7|nr:hypothetical protein FVEG_14702 [Fusarium verticillioides 7600]EWG36714.1 hypothetical protein FVEG_14702 [Fusarium verticillioides 7600]
MRKHRLKLFIINILTSRNDNIHYFSFNEVEVGRMGLSIRLLTFSRGYATRSGGSRIKPTLSLDQFIQRGRVLAFYRTILRGTKKIADPTTRAESRKYARDEFERRRNVADAVCSLIRFSTNSLTVLSKSHVRYLLSIGKTEWEGMERYIDGM